LVKFRFSQAERNIYRKRKHVPVSRWVEQGRIVTRGPLEGTPWRNRTTPYLAGIMDASFYHGVEEIYVCAPPQTGKSAMVDSCIGYAIDRAPGPVIYVYPDEDTAAENMKDRILPMIQKSGQLRRYLTGSADDEAAKRVNLQHMQIYMSWARSAIKLGNKSARYAVADEIDKYPDTANLREASPLNLLRARLTTYRYNRKLWVISTPTIEAGPIWQLMTTEAQAVFDFWVRCPQCKKWQTMTFKQIRWPKEERDPEKVVSGNLARYECEHCKTHWDDYQRDLAVRPGHWRERTTGRKLFPYLKDHRPRKIGFQLRSWMSHFVGLSEVAASFLWGLKDKNKLKDFKNKHEAEPWKEYSVERKEDKILALRDERPFGLVPGGGAVACLTAGVDTQDNGCWYEVRAWGYGLTMESWQIRSGFVDTFDAVAKILFDEKYSDADGLEYFVRMAVQDSGGHKTSEVYDFARARRGRLLAFKGEQRMRQPFAFSKIDTYPGSNKMIPGGLMLLRADTNFFKNLLAGKLEVAPADPGAWHLSAETTEEWARHMCAEYIDDKTQLWVNPSSRANHGWDCSVLNLVAADVLRVKFWKVPARPAVHSPPAVQGSGLKEQGERPKWLGERGTWLKR
jgi:phage terminase large subunit GpA-like protein